MGRKMVKVIGRELVTEKFDTGWVSKYANEDGRYYRHRKMTERSFWVGKLECGHTSENALDPKTKEICKKRMICYWCEDPELVASMAEQGRPLF